MKATRHNGRSGKNGTYNPRHNDRRFDLENSEHIDAGRVRENIYWDCYRGYTTMQNREEDSKAWVLSPERKASQKERTYAVSRLDGVITKITKAMQTAVKTIQTTLIKPEVKKVNTEQIKKKARSSILDKLAKAKITAEQENRERWEHEGRTKLGRNDMEL